MHWVRAVQVSFLVFHMLIQEGEKEIAVCKRELIILGYKYYYLIILEILLLNELLRKRITTVTEC